MPVTHCGHRSRRPAMPSQEGNKRDGVRRRNRREVDQGARPSAGRGTGPLPLPTEMLDSIKDHLSRLLSPVKEIFRRFCPPKEEKARIPYCCHHPPPYDCPNSSPFPDTSRRHHLVEYCKETRRYHQEMLAEYDIGAAMVAGGSGRRRRRARSDVSDVSPGSSPPRALSGSSSWEDELETGSRRGGSGGMGRRRAEGWDTETWRLGREEYLKRREGSRYTKVLQVFLGLWFLCIVYDAAVGFGEA